MGQELCHIKLSLKVQSCLGDLPGKWDRISISSWLNPLMHWLMGWKSLSFFNRMVTLTRADQIQHSPVWQLLLLTVLSSLWRESSLSCRDGDPPPCIAPSVHHTLTHRSWIFVCLLKNCSSVVSGELTCFITLGVGQLFPDVDGQITGTLPGLYKPPVSPDSVSCVFVLVVFEIPVVSLGC